MVDIIPNSQVVIGHGAFSIVYRARLKSRPNQIVAIKAISKKNLAKSQNLLGKEIKILKELTLLQHENVVALLDCKETSNHVYLVMEYCNGGDLADYLNVKGTLSEDTIRLFLRQLAGAIQAMVSKGIVHRDLKPQNILMSHEGRTKNPHPHDIVLKIADFGFARFLQDGVMAATLCGSPMYMAPEVIMSLQYNSKADLWSLGTIVFQCLTGKAPFQAQTPQALKHFYEKNSNLAPKIPSGTTADLTNLLMGMLKRDSRDRIDFDTFFNHPFLKPPTSVVTPSLPIPVPSSNQTPNSEASCKMGSLPETHAKLNTPHNSAPTVIVGRNRPWEMTPPLPGILPPSPVSLAKFSPSPKQDIPSVTPKPMETSSGIKCADKHQDQGANSSPDGTDSEDFVMVPAHLTMDAAENRKQARLPVSSRPSPAMRRHTIGHRPSHLSLQMGPEQHTDPIPVPTQKAAYQQIQQSLVRSRSRSGDSVSAMSGVSSASGGSTLGPLPEEVLHNRNAGMQYPRQSPLCSPKTPDKIYVRRKSNPPVLDICQMSPPAVQFTMGQTPAGHRRRTSSSSSCGTPPPTVQWQISPHSPTHNFMLSPLRRVSSLSQTQMVTNVVPTLSPIEGSPSKTSHLDPVGATTAVLKWNMSQTSSGLISSHAYTVPENLSSAFEAGSRAAMTGRYDTSHIRRRSSDLQLVSGRNVVLNYSQTNTFEPRPGLLVRKSSRGKENQSPIQAAMLAPPPDLSEETLMSAEHNESLAKLKFVSLLVDTIIEVARHKAAPLSAITESAMKNYTEEDSPNLRKLHQLLLYMRCLHLLSQTLEFSRAELKAKRLKPSTSVKNVLATLNERFRHCISMTKMLNSENILNESGLEPQSTAVTADKILYNYAIELCQSAALDELFGNPDECFQRYHGAHVLLHALQFQTTSQEDQFALAKYKDAVEKRLHVLEQQGFIQAYESY